MAAFRLYWGPPAWHSRWVNERGKPASQKPLTAEVSAKQSIKCQLHITVGAVGWELHSSSTSTCAGKVDHEKKKNQKQGATHGLAITSRMHTAISGGQWQPWTAVRPYWYSAWHSRWSVTGENPCFFCLFRGGHTWQSAMSSNSFNNTEHRHKTTALNDTRLYVTS